MHDFSTLFSQAFRIAKRELRGGIKGFKIFLACLTLGVAAIAGVGSLGSAIEYGLKVDARKLLGGDVDLRLTHHEFSQQQRDWFQQYAKKTSQVAQLRAMAVRLDRQDRRLIEVKAVDQAYPLFGKLETKNNINIDLTRPNTAGDWPAIVGKNLLERLSLGIGASFKIGEAQFFVADVITVEPDRGTQAFNLGPRVIMSRAALDASGLIVPGSLIRYHMRIAIENPDKVGEFVQALKTEFPQAGWRLRDLDNAAPNIQRFIDRVRMFLTLVGLTALLVGGVGIGNAVSAYLESRTGVIATLKSIGASSRLIFTTYLIQLLIIGGIGTGVGALIGAGAPIVIAPLLEGRLPVNLQIGFYPLPVLMAILYGMLTVILFSFLPLARARMVRAADLFRARVGFGDKHVGWRNMAVIAVLSVILGVLAIISAHQPKFALFFVVGALVALLTFRAVAWAIIYIVRLLPRVKNLPLRLALDSIQRPGSSAPGVIVSLGLGLTVLATIALIEGNLNRQVKQVLRGEAPGFYFIDIQPYQIDAFRATVKTFPGVTQSEDVPMLRGRIIALKGIPVEEYNASPEAAWVLRGDRGLTWSRKAPTSGKIIEGEWWPEDYQGETLLSFAHEEARQLGLSVGDKVRVNILGREIDVTIANLREVDWTSLGANFVMVFSPGLLEKAPQSYVTTVHLDEDQENALEKALVEQFPNISSIRVKEVLENVAAIVGQLGLAVRSIASVAVIAGVFVLAGALAAGRQKRLYETVLFKVIGATRKNIMTAYILEYLVMGIITAFIAAAFGAFASWGVIEQFMEAEWIFLPEVLGTVLSLSLFITILLGGISGWSALGTRASRYLRNE